MAFTCWQASEGHLRAAGLGLVGSLTFLCFGHLDKIKKFKATTGGFEAETRDRISRTETDIGELKDLTERIREEIDRTPYLVYARLPFVGQNLLVKLYHQKELDLDQFCPPLSEHASREQIESIVFELEKQHDWFTRDGHKLSITQSGIEAVQSFIGLTVIRFHD